MIALRQPNVPEPDEPFHGYRFVKGIMIALAIELAVAATIAGLYYGCHQGP